MTNTLTTGLDTLTPKTIGGLAVQPVAEAETFLNVLIYGESGVGKTVLSGSATDVPGMAPVLLIDVEGGTLSLRNRYADVDVIRVSHFDRLQGVYNDLYRGSHYNTVIVDSLTELQKFSMSTIMKDVIAKDSTRDEDVPAQRDWGKNQEQIRRFVRGFRDLPMHTIFTALSKEDKDMKTGMTRIRPSLPGKLAGEIAGFVDIVVYYSIRYAGEGGNVRVLQTTSTEKVLAKDRSGRLPALITDPTMTTLIDHMNNPNQKDDN